jgi:Uma2 family endonuclease
MQAGVSVREYLTGDFELDCDYVNGLLEERNFGEYDHGRLQALIGSYFLGQRAAGIRCALSLRIRTGERRFRVADVVVTAGIPKEQVLTCPPLLCVEVLSPEDRFIRTVDRADDYLNMGVPEVWIINPESLRTYVCDSTGLHEVRERVLVTKDGRVRLDLDAIEQDLRD